MRIPALLLAAAALAAPMRSVAQIPTSALPTYSYADLADLAAATPIVAVGQIRDAIRLKDGTGIPAGTARFYVEADIRSLLRGAAGLPARIRYLADVPLGAKNRAPKLRKMQVMLLARPVPGRADEVQLVARDGQLPWSQALETQVRSILLAATAPDAPPRITGVAKAFHVPGAVPGESETQIFLSTEDGRPVSLNVLRRPGETPRWAVALGEMVDEAAAPPARDTLLWYRLSCTLAPQLPSSSIEGLTPGEAAAAQQDYALVLAGLGRCNRTRPAA
jgi:hypothetical protein